MNVELTEEQRIKVMNSKRVYDVMKKILLRENEIEREQEHFWVICLAANNKILAIELISLGAVDETIVKPMQVFRVAILKGAVKLIMVHNHPSRELKPSPNDKGITDRMIQVGRIVNVEVIDHLIITTENFYSFDDHGLMARLRMSKKWIPRYKEEERIRAEALELGKKEGAKGKAIEIAKTLKENGVDIPLIAKSSGLSKEEIEEL